MADTVTEECDTNGYPARSGSLEADARDVSVDDEGIDKLLLSSCGPEVLAPKQADIQLTVLTLSGNLLRSQRFQKSETVGGVLQALRKSCRLQGGGHQLVFEGSVLRRHTTLEENGLEEGSTAHLIMNSGFEKIALYGNSLGSDGIRAFASKLASVNCLRIIDIRACSLGKESGGQAVAVLVTAAPSLEVLNLACNEGFGPDGVSAMARALPTGNVLTSVDLGSCGLSGAAGGNALALLVTRTPKLSHLSASKNSGLCIRAFGMALPELSAITKVILDNCDLHGSEGGEGVVLLIHKLTALREMHLSKSQAAILDVVVQGIAGDIVLDTVYLNDCGMHERTHGKALALLLQRATRLKSLVVSSNKMLGAIGLDTVARHIGQVNLAHLICEQCGLNGREGALAVVAILQKMPKLTRLSISFNKIDFEVLAENMCQHESLQELFLCHCGLWGPRSARAVAAMVQKFNKLWWCEFEGNDGLGGAGLEAFVSELPIANALTRLNLKSCKLEGAAAGFALVRLLQKASKLDILNLDGNDLGTEGLQACASGFDQCENLAVLSLDFSTQIAAEISDITRRLPSLKELTLSQPRAELCRATNTINDDLQIDMSTLEKLIMPPGCFHGPRGGRVVAQLLQGARSLDTLLIGHNINLGHSGVEALAMDLAEHPLLKHIGLEALGLEAEDGGKAIAQLLERAKHVQTICLDANRKLTDSGVAALARHLDSSAQKIVEISLTGCGLEDVLGGHAAGHLASVLTKHT